MHKKQKRRVIRTETPCSWREYQRHKPRTLNNTMKLFFSMAGHSFCPLECLRNRLESGFTGEWTDLTEVY